MRPTLLTWLLTLAECVFGFWLSTVGWSFAGGIIVGLAVGTQLARVNRALFWKH